MSLGQEVVPSDANVSTISTMLHANDPSMRDTPYVLRSKKGIFKFAADLPDESIVRSLYIKSLRIDVGEVIAISAALAKLPFLETFAMVNCTCTTDSVTSTLASALAKKDYLRRLTISRCNMGNRGAEMLASASLSPSVRTFEFSHDEIDDAGAIALSSCLSQLSIIRLHDNRIGAEGAAAIARAIAESSTVQLLELSNNHMGRDGAIALSSVFGNNGKARLRTLHLRGNAIDAEGTSKLAAAIASDRHLQRLDMTENTMGNEGAISVASMLVTNNTLRFLYLSRNNISAKGTLELARNVAKNQTLESLGIVEEVDASDDIRAAFKEALYDDTSIETIVSGSNHTLKQIDLAGGNLRNIDSSRSLRSLLYFNQNMPVVSMRMKIAKFLNEKPTAIASMGIDERLMALLLGKVAKECGLNAMFQLVRNIPDVVTSGSGIGD